MDLPIHAVLAQLVEALDAAPNAVLVAPPGAGKTTVVAPALLDRTWCGGRVLLLSPRRLAARAAAERMAEMAGEKPGHTIGYATRMDSRQSDASRVLVLTEGIFLNMVRDDPELDGVSAVLFDEVHERSLDSDFGLALALEAQAAFRPDLRLIAMSATLDGARFGELMGQDGKPAPTIESAGASHPLTVRYAGRKAEQPIEQSMASAVRSVLATEQGDVLAFLPGVGEIERTARRLEEAGLDAALHRLYGAMDPAAQRNAIRPDADGRRKIILATSIAETSLTIDGVRIVIDSGLARRPRYDAGAGVTRLVTERSSRASATQRAGRAARQGPGIAIRLWEEAATVGLPAYNPPEILESDLTPLVLQCAEWGEADPARLNWLDPPPEASLAAAGSRLQAIGALDADGTITPHGAKLAALPMPPHIAHMLVRAGENGQADEAARIAAVLQERGLGGQSENLEARVQRFERERGRRADTARSLARRWAKLASETTRVAAITSALSAGALLALAYPERLSRRRYASGESWQSVDGRGFRLDPTSPLAASEWLAVAEVQGVAAGARILSAIAMSRNEVETQFVHRIESASTVAFNPDRNAAEARRVRRLGEIVLSREPDPSPDANAVLDCLLDAVRSRGLDILPWGKAARALRVRARFAGKSALENAALLERLDHWLAPLLAGCSRFSEISATALHHALEGELGWEALQDVNRMAPTEFTTPARTTHSIDYGAESGPAIEVRVQALYGVSEHPKVGAEHIPLVLHLTSPAGRPVQTTRDLPAFWKGSWADVAREMRGRYPRHNWPDHPASATPSLKTKKAQARDR